MEDKNEEKEIIDVSNKSSEEIISAFAKVSDDVLTLYEQLNKYGNNEQALKEYQKIKSLKNNK